MALTGKQELFAREYIKDLNASAAALRAGYAPATALTASRLILPLDEVQAYIANLCAERNKALQIDAQRVLAEVLEIAMADPAAAYDEHGAFHQDVHKIPAALRKTIASIKTREERAVLGAAVTTEIVEVKFWDKTKALDMLMRHLALYQDKLKLEGLDGIAEKILEARRRAGR